MFGNKYRKVYVEPTQALDEFRGDKEMNKNQLRMREKFADLEESDLNEENLGSDPTLMREDFDPSAVDDWDAVVDKFQGLVDSGADPEDAAAETAEFFGTRFDDSGEPIEPFTKWQLLSAVESGGGTPEAGPADELGEPPEAESEYAGRDDIDMDNLRSNAEQERTYLDDRYREDNESDWVEENELKQFNENLRGEKKLLSIRKERINSELMRRWGYEKK